MGWNDRCSKAGMRALLLGVLGVLSLLGCATRDPEDPTQASGSAIETGERIEETAPASACTPATTCSGIAPRKRDPNRCTFLVAFDGSGVYSPDVHSNIGRIYEEAVGAKATSGAEGLNGEVVDAKTTRVYIEGVPGLPFGASAERVERGRSAICQHLALRAADDCDIVLLGYSRGAFIANEIAHALHDHGCADGSHRGQRIAFLGAFDPVNTQMGSEWEDERTGIEHVWHGDVPPNVENVLQIYKDPKEDPRGGLEGLTLTTSLMSTGAVPSSCAAPMTAANHPEGKDWHHGEVGHGDLPRDVMKCALERAKIRLW